MEDNLLLKELDLKSTVITALLLSCDKNLEALGKLNLQGKKALENMVNIFFEISMINKANSEQSATRVLLKNIRKMHITSLLIKLEQRLSEVEEIYLKIANQAEALEKTLQNLNEIFGKVSEKFTAKTKGEPRSLSLAQLSSKAEALLLLSNLLTSIAPGVQKDCKLKRRLLDSIRKFMGLIAEDRVLGNDDSDSLKYFLQVWIHRPYVEEELCRHFSELCLEFVQIREGFA